MMRTSSFLPVNCLKLPKMQKQVFELLNDQGLMPGLSSRFYADINEIKRQDWVAIFNDITYYQSRKKQYLPQKVRTCQEIPASRRSSFIILWPSVVKNLSLELQTHFPVSPIEKQASKFIFHAFTHKYQSKAQPLTHLKEK